MCFDLLHKHNQEHYEFYKLITSNKSFGLCSLYSEPMLWRPSVVHHFQISCSATMGRGTKKVMNVELHRTKTKI